jgi:hypothetical protein
MRGQLMNLLWILFSFSSPLFFSFVCPGVFESSRHVRSVRGPAEAEQVDAGRAAAVGRASSPLDGRRQDGKIHPRVSDHLNERIKFVDVILCELLKFLRTFNFPLLLEMTEVGTAVGISYVGNVDNSLERFNVGSVNHQV